MISTIEPPGSPRRAHPAVGRGFDPDRLEVVVDGIALCCTAMRDEGVTAALHPHVGGWVETEHELRAVLDGVGPDLLAFGPDTGHMSWAGMDVPAVLLDYADRIVGVHLKDTFAAGITAAAADDLDYQMATEPGRIWAEPGLGDVDLTACLAAFPADFAGDYMIEVDVPSLPLRDCHQVAYDWALATLPQGVRP
jgi:inosose dehydratase